ncbi:MAG: hypothetical protein H8E34_02885 [Bacteroidetes bacterium]|nr:hypothetical protein [Bacteroidota bacterium]MBL6943886.1 hypothetical protein [Bacteroidales bacterium]
MKYIYVIASLTVVALMSSCGSGKQLTQKKEIAKQYYNAGNYNNALLEYTEVIMVYENNNNSSECSIYTNAGESALKVGNTKLSIDNLNKAKNTRFANEYTYLYLAEGYKQIDNLSQEIRALVDYLDLYPNGKEVSVVKTRLFYTLVESDNFEKAIELWPYVYSDNQQNIQLYEAYLIANIGLNDINACNDVAKQLLSLDANNIDGLSWFGKYYYYKAEDHYREEMNSYEINKTNKQYSILLKALEVITDDFKKSLTYFKKNYALQPTSEIANYLSHIYGRLSDKNNEAYYKALAK